MSQNNQQDELKIILLVLEKAEQILSLVNLPESTINKYNELKQISCNKLNMEFFPLTKSSINQTLTSTKVNINTINQDHLNTEVLIKYILILRELLNKKNALINFFVNLIENYIISPNINSNTSVEYLISILIKKLESHSSEFYNVNNTNILSGSVNLDDLEFDLKLEDIKIKEMVSKAETSAKRLNLFIKEEKMRHGNYGMKMNVSEILLIKNNIYI